MSTFSPMTCIPGDGRLATTNGAAGPSASYKGDSGHFIYGPYIDLDDGDYIAEFTGEVRDFGERGAAFEVVQKKPEIEGRLIDLAKHIGGPLRSGLLAALPFTVRKRASDVEFRVFPTKNCDITISAVHLNKVKKERPKTDRPLWVLITGTLREPFIVRSRFRFLGELKQKGIIDGVVFSTWYGEVDKDPGIAKLIDDYGFELVESTEPEILCLGHFMHQMRALDHGLDACPDGAFVLKSRTDKTGPSEGFFEPDIEEFLAAREFAHPCNSRVSAQRFKIGIFGYAAFNSTIGPNLCLWHDQSYFGLKSDLKRLVNYNVFAFDIHHMAPEQALFSYPILNKFTAIDRLFRAADQYEMLFQISVNLSRSPTDKINRFGEITANNKLFRHAVVLERMYLNECFFNLDTNQSFPLDLTYRGISLDTFPDVEQCLQTFGNGRDLDAAYQEDEVAFRTAAKELFGIEYRHEMRKEIRDGMTVFVAPPIDHKARYDRR